MENYILLGKKINRRNNSEEVCVGFMFVNGSFK